MNTVNPEVRDAKNIYLWLWLSPLLLFVTAPIAGGFAVAIVPSYVKWQWAVAVTALLVALPHLWLLLPAIIAKSEFVRWHARQVLLIAVAQSLVLPLSLIGDAIQGTILRYTIFGTLLALIVWFIGNFFGHENAAHGDCTLMRVFGRGAMLPLPVRIEIEPSSESSREGDALVEIIRTSRDSFARGIALDELRRLGLVEEL